MAASPKTKGAKGANRGRFTKERPGPGRPKGVPNKINGNIKAWAMEALTEDDPVQFFRDCKANHPKEFLAFIGKMLPRDVSVTSPVQIQIVTGIDPSLGEPGAES